MFAGWPRPALEVDPSARGLSHCAFADAGIEVLLVGSSECGGEHDPDMKAVLATLRTAVRTSASKQAPKTVELIQRLARVDPALNHNEDLARLRGSKSSWTCPVRIAVVHHPVSALPYTEVSAWSALLNAGEFKSLLLELGFSLVCHGHMHNGWFAEESWPDRHHDRTLRIVAAPSLASVETVGQAHGFNEILVRRENEARTVTVKRWVHAGGGFKLDGEMGPFAPPAA